MACFVCGKQIETGNIYTLSYGNTHSLNLCKNCGRQAIDLLTEEQRHRIESSFKEKSIEALLMTGAMTVVAFLYAGLIALIL